MRCRAQPTARRFVFETHNVPCKTNPLGVKGAGEAGAIGSCPAVVNAIIDGLWRNTRSTTSTCRRRPSGSGSRSGSTSAGIACEAVRAREDAVGVCLAPAITVRRRSSKTECAS